MNKPKSILRNLNLIRNLSEFIEYYNKELRPKPKIDFDNFFSLKAHVIDSKNKISLNFFKIEKSRVSINEFFFKLAYYTTSGGLGDLSNLSGKSFSFSIGEFLKNSPNKNINSGHILEEIISFLKSIIYKIDIDPSKLPVKSKYLDSIPQDLIPVIDEISVWFSNNPNSVINFPVEKNILNILRIYFGGGFSEYLEQLAKPIFDKIRENLQKITFDPKTEKKDRKEFLILYFQLILNILKYSLIPLFFSHFILEHFYSEKNLTSLHGNLNTSYKMYSASLSSSTEFGKIVIDKFKKIKVNIIKEIEKDKKNPEVKERYQKIRKLILNKTIPLKVTELQKSLAFLLEKSLTNYFLPLFGNVSGIKVGFKANPSSNISIAAIIGLGLLPAKAVVFYRVLRAIQDRLYDLKSSNSIDSYLDSQLGGKKITSPFLKLKNLLYFLTLEIKQNSEKGKENLEKSIFDFFEWYFNPNVKGFPSKEEFTARLEKAIDYGSEEVLLKNYIAIFTRFYYLFRNKNYSDELLRILDLEVSNKILNSQNKDRGLIGIHHSGYRLLDRIFDRLRVNPDSLLIEFLDSAKNKALFENLKIFFNGTAIGPFLAQAIRFNAIYTSSLIKDFDKKKSHEFFEKVLDRANPSEYGNINSAHTNFVIRNSEAFLAFKLVEKIAEKRSPYTSLAENLVKKVFMSTDLVNYSKLITILKICTVPLISLINKKVKRTLTPKTSEVKTNIQDPSKEKKKRKQVTTIKRNVITTSSIDAGIPELEEISQLDEELIDPLLDFLVKDKSSLSIEEKEKVLKDFFSILKDGFINKYMKVLISEIRDVSSRSNSAYKIYHRLIPLELLIYLSFFKDIPNVFINVKGDTKEFKTKLFSESYLKAVGIYLKKILKNNLTRKDDGSSKFLIELPEKFREYRLYISSRKDSIQFLLRKIILIKEFKKKMEQVFLNRKLDKVHSLYNISEKVTRFFPYLSIKNLEEISNDPSIDPSNEEAAINFVKKLNSIVPEGREKYKYIYASLNKNGVLKNSNLLQYFERDFIVPFFSFFSLLSRSNLKIRVLRNFIDSRFFKAIDFLRRNPYIAQKYNFAPINKRINKDVTETKEQKLEEDLVQYIKPVLEGIIDYYALGIFGSLFLRINQPIKLPLLSIIIDTPTTRPESTFFSMILSFLKLKRDKIVIGYKKSKKLLIVIGIPIPGFSPALYNNEDISELSLFSVLGIPFKKQLYSKASSYLKNFNNLSLGELDTEGFRLAPFILDGKKYKSLENFNLKEVLKTSEIVENLIFQKFDIERKGEFFTKYKEIPNIPHDFILEPKKYLAVPLINFKGIEDFHIYIDQLNLAVAIFNFLSSSYFSIYLGFYESLNLKNEKNPEDQGSQLMGAFNIDKFLKFLKSISSLEKLVSMPSYSSLYQDFRPRKLINYIRDPNFIDSLNKGGTGLSSSVFSYMDFLKETMKLKTVPRTKNKNIPASPFPSSQTTDITYYILSSWNVFEEVSSNILYSRALSEFSRGYNLYSSLLNKIFKSKDSDSLKSISKTLYGKSSYNKILEFLEALPPRRGWSSFLSVANRHLVFNINALCGVKLVEAISESFGYSSFAISELRKVFGSSALDFAKYLFDRNLSTIQDNPPTIEEESPF